MSKNERYTPDNALEFACAALGGIQLDPCADPHRRVGAMVSYTQAEDGLSVNWADFLTVFVNPPYGRGEMMRWVQHGIECLRFSEEQTQLWLVPARTTAKWSKLLLGAARAVAEQPFRYHFLGPDYLPIRDENGKRTSPDFDTRWVLLSKKPDRSPRMPCGRFALEARERGMVVLKTLDTPRTEGR